MPRPESNAAPLGLKAGEWVEVRSREEILATLDSHGRTENLPFMPEMLRYCGQRFRVFKRADKTCDPAHAPWTIRRMRNSVHLDGLRCDGEGHGGCQAGCLIFWKEAWLKRLEDRASSPENPVASRPKLGNELASMEENVLSSSRRVNSEGKTIYSCQATELRNFTSHMSAWDPRQYIRDLRSGNLDSGLAAPLRAHRVLELVLGIITIIRTIVISLFNEVQETRHSALYPSIVGAGGKVAAASLDLQAGEIVQIRSKEEIMQTLGSDQRNRGLWFDSEMLPFCGGYYRVLRRVHRIIDENSGQMIEMKHPCIVLEGVVCQSDFHRLCPRAIFPYWRESWLKRVSSAAGARPPLAHEARNDADDSPSGTSGVPTLSASMTPVSD